MSVSDCEALEATDSTRGIAVNGFSVWDLQLCWRMESICRLIGTDIMRMMFF